MRLVYSHSFTANPSWQTNNSALKTGSLVHASNPLQWSILPSRPLYEVNVATFIEQNGQLVWSEMLQALLLQPKMDYQIFINNNLFSRHVSLVLRCPRTINLWSGNSDIAPVQSSPQTWEHICAYGWWRRGHTESLAINTVGLTG